MTESWKRTTKPVSDLCALSASGRLPVVVKDSSGEEFTVTRLTWIGRTCYLVCEGQSWELRACHVRKIKEPK